MFPVYLLCSWDGSWTWECVEQTSATFRTQHACRRNAEQVLGKGRRFIVIGCGKYAA